MGEVEGMRGISSDEVEQVHMYWKPKPGGENVHEKLVTEDRLHAPNRAA